MMNPMADDTILIVEDDLDIRNTIQDALEIEGYNVLTASNGKEALEILEKSEKPCLILMDLMMPVMGGRECIDILKKDIRLASIPIFVISSIADKQNTIGAVGFIKKPADLNILLKMVQQYC